ncbi:MAG: type II CAAX endopeptidase family protein [Chloroflexota bacterium]
MNGLSRRPLTAVRNDNFIAVAFGYLVLIMFSEIVTVWIVPQATALLFGLLQFQFMLMLFLISLHAAVRWHTNERNVLLSLAMVPIIRLISLSLPLANIPLIYWYFIISIPIFIAAFMMVRELGYSWDDIGLNGRYLLWQIPIALSGFVIGFLEFIILEPRSPLQTFTWVQYVMAGLILLISTGFLEELIFRRIMQINAVERFGRGFGIIYVAAIFGVMHIGYNSFTDVLFVFIAGLYLGWVVDVTNSIVGATIAHGIANITLFLIMPALGYTPEPITMQFDFIQVLQDNAGWLVLLAGSFFIMRMLMSDPVIIEDQR